MPNEQLEKTQQQLITLRQAEQQLNEIKNKLDAKFDDLDKLLRNHADVWSKHREDYFTKLVNLLKEKGLALSAEEQKELRTITATSANIKEKQAALEKLGVDTSKFSDFAIAACGTISSALSRTLQKVDAKSIKEVLTK